MGQRVQLFGWQEIFADALKRDVGIHQVIFSAGTLEFYVFVPFVHARG